VISLVGPVSLVGSRVIALGSFAFLVVFDLWWRYTQESCKSPWRFVSPTSGGAIFFIPLWGAVACMALVGLVLYATAKP
jgi:hypothetical protein